MIQWPKGPHSERRITDGIDTGVYLMLVMVVRVHCDVQHLSCLILHSLHVHIDFNYQSSFSVLCNHWCSQLGRLTFHFPCHLVSPFKLLSFFSFLFFLFSLQFSHGYQIFKHHIFFFEQLLNAPAFWPTEVHCCRQNMSPFLPVFHFFLAICQFQEYVYFLLGCLAISTSWSLQKCFCKNFCGGIILKCRDVQIIRF